MVYAAKLETSAELVDPRNGGNSSAWKPNPGTPSGSSGTTLGSANAGAPPAGPNPTTSKYHYFDWQRAYYDSVSARPSIGMISVVPLGMQRNIPYLTPKFQPGGGGNPPDWLLLDLVAPSMRPHTYMNSVMGKININAKLHGGGAAWVADDRTQPLKALFKNLVPDAKLDTLVQNIINHTGGADYGASGRYNYIGELCEIAGIADSGTDDWSREALIRNIANLVTTQSNTFTVWGLAQDIQKKPGNTNYGVFEPGDSIQSEKRFSSGIERYVWPGNDGVAGNGAVNAKGAYNKTATGSQSGTFFNGEPSLGDLPWLPLPNPKPPDTSSLSGAKWPIIDGPDAPTYPNATKYGARSQPAGEWGSDSNPNYQKSTLEAANNPLRAWMKYRMLDFHYTTP